MQRVLLINQNIKDSRLLKKTFQNYYPATEIVKARDSVGGLDILLHERVDTIFIDSVFSLTDIDFLGEVQKNNITTPVIVIIEEGKEILAAEAIKKGACDYIIKDAGYPDSLPDVIERTRSASILKKDAEEKGNNVHFFLNKYIKAINGGKI